MEYSVLYNFLHKLFLLFILTLDNIISITHFHSFKEEIMDLHTGLLQKK
jgi:hypothetical protein